MHGKPEVSRPSNLTVNPAGGNPANSIYYHGNHDETQLGEMDKFSCWKPAMVLAGLGIAVVGLFIAGAGFGLFGVGGVISAPIGSVICAVGVALMTGGGVLWYREREEANSGFTNTIVSPPFEATSPYATSHEDLLHRYPSLQNNIEKPDQ